MAISKKDFLDSLTYFHTRLKAEMAGIYVPSEVGKGLSTNDYTTTEKEQLKALVDSGGGGSETVTEEDIDGIFDDNTANK